MEGPYRDLGAGFARLTGVEGARRGPSRISHVEDALLELLRNARDAGAGNIFVASTLTRRRFRTLTVLDDGRGIPEAYADLIFEPGVTTRHLDPVPDPAPGPRSQTGNPPGTLPTSAHGAGLSLYHLRQAAVDARVSSCGPPTAITTTFDTLTLPERTLQSTARPSKSNLRATVQTFLRDQTPHTPPNTYYGPPARVLATLIHNRIIQQSEGSVGLVRVAGNLGLRVSHRTVQRLLRGEVPVLRAEGSGDAGGGSRRRARRDSVPDRGSEFSLGLEERAGIAAILERSARSAYLELEDLKVESRPGEIVLRARVYEPEEEYE